MTAAEAAVPHAHLMRPCRADEFDTMLAIVNEAARAYRDVIPNDCWHDPYMTAAALRSDMAAGVVFTGCEIGGTLVGIMGIQRVRTIDLIRHAYVSTRYQGHGVGGALLEYLRRRAGGQVLVGTWAAAIWAVDFYQRHGFRLVPEETKARLLRAFWTVSDRQIETSVVLASPALTSEDAHTLLRPGQA